ncbi:hypothetical protein [Roseimarinus sediminis]|uniref:hypothetical protein n=1 Tax=Roseimarinus sediminis TaxID=1610899 RepID=UPI003D223C6A
MKWILILASALFVASCTGPAGMDGIDGRDGRDGIANVGAAIYDVDPSSWTGNIDGFTCVLDVPEISQYVYENGAVLVYVLQNEGYDDQHFNQLPYTWLNNSMTEYMDFNAFVGSVEITLRWVDDGMNVTEAPVQPYSFKLIIIEGTPLAVLESRVDISDPEAVLNYLK